MNGGQSQQDRMVLAADRDARTRIAEMAKAQAECLAMIAALKGLSGQETRA